jgi:hypothetical protein
MASDDFGPKCERRGKRFMPAPMPGPDVAISGVADASNNMKGRALSFESYANFQITQVVLEQRLLMRPMITMHGSHRSSAEKQATSKRNH